MWPTVNKTGSEEALIVPRSWAKANTGLEGFLVSSFRRNHFSKHTSHPIQLGKKYLQC